jgi:hypothetical protein
VTEDINGNRIPGKVIQDTLVYTYEKNVLYTKEFLIVKSD